MRLLCKISQRNVPTTLVTANVLNAALYKLLNLEGKPEGYKYGYVCRKSGRALNMRGYPRALKDNPKGNSEKDFLIWRNLRIPIAELFDDETDDIRRRRIRQQAQAVP